jgi:hypothetical protein
MHDPKQVLEQLRKIMQPYGTVVSLVPMLTTLGYWSTTWHLSLQVPSDDAAQPPPIITILDKQVICDIPGKRRFCKHCDGVEHVLASCRQGQRMRRAARQLQQAQSALTASLQHQQQHDQQQDALALNDQMDFQPTHLNWAVSQASRGGTGNGTDNNNGNDNGNGNRTDNGNSTGNVHNNGIDHFGDVSTGSRTSSNVSGGHGRGATQ